MKNIFENCKSKEDMDLVHTTMLSVLKNDQNRVQHEQELNSMYQSALSTLVSNQTQLDKLRQTVDQVSDIFSVVKTFLHSIK